MFYLNLGHAWSHLDLEGLEAAILLPHGNSMEKIVRKAPEVRTLLFDPQLYLAGLDCASSALVCSRLVSYPWFGAEDVPEFNSDNMNRTEWQRLVRESIDELWRGSPVDVDEQSNACETAIEFQQSIGCSQIILPSPMVSEREDEAATQAAWLDAGVAAANAMDVDVPVLATVAVSDFVLNDAAFQEFGILDTLVDQITSREGIDGVYIVVAQSNANHPFESPRAVLRAYQYLARAFSEAGYEYIITNFADVFGLACYASGATGFATGPSHALRRLSLTSFDDEGFGIALPFLYSHRTVAEFASESDLNVITANGLLRRVRDVTPPSERLLSVLAAGGSASSLAAWAESRNNVKAAKTHFLSRMILAEENLASTPVDERPDEVKDWLESAAANVLYLRDKIGSPSFSRLKGHIAPTGTWTTILDL